MDNKILFLPGLNGIRAFAAMGVLLSHINLSLNNFGLKNASFFGYSANGKQKGYVLGEHGVTMFFVLSGFLISFLLLNEYKKINTIKVKEFYIRRILRIWPLYFLYIILVGICYYLFLNLSFNYNLVYYLFFAANVPFVNEVALPAMDHLWSIAVEEQFYLFWPFLFVFLVKNGKFSTYLIGGIIFLSIFRIFIWYIAPFSITALYSVVNRFDCMFFGAMGAYALYKNFRIIDLLGSRLNQLFCLIILALLILNKFWFINSIIEIFIVEYITLGLIIGQIKVKNRIINLENKPLNYLGKISFGVYVYHPLIILISSHFIKYNNQINGVWFLIFIFFIVISATLVVSHLSFFYFEKKFLKLKHRFSIVKSTNDPQGK
ncbi:hypothetical protein OA84_04760 [Kaistella solincola]|uniref:Acyltransferase 3 domain-containing protein n=1 Tax=Kaistella solincola TaxID=510955 RepID=A0ABR4ZQ48_9FLAO|nr:acyltransferase [Kaistella solincola]KIA82884.1 hypothetical protein OA84_04760 [Kaistella solincola]